MKEDSSINRQQKINIPQIFASKNPGLAPLIPGFIYSYLNRILHVDFINEFLDRHGDKKDLEFIKAIKEDFNITTEIIGLENIPADKKLIVVANHPLGGIDGTILLGMLGEKFPRVKNISNDILMNIPNLQGIFVPVNKHGRQTKEVAEKIDAVYKSDDPILSFPSGLVSRKKRGVIKDLDWKKSFITKSKSYQRDVIPVWVSGKCSNFFYNLANFRTFFGIKSNLEMFFLPDETYKHKNSHIKVVIGKAIPYQSFDNRLKPEEWANKIKDFVYTLENDSNAQFLY
ncbi:MAG: 1-acyl-sn-glycerol-3-phosphate acyltransferase [Bacteroidales bacterium]|nr:1-acyl-sn-glycerol-3-phosphate acyltransferase [Bacteroidales bacterium]MCF8391562.1 1-acyl-sn-glycerol-3-phosphate acyltransferase [Bacteroidales bacterium]